MKKSLKNILLTLIMLLCFKVNYVIAAEPLVCVYEGGLQSESTMLIQNIDGTISVKTHLKDSLDIDDSGWYTPSEDFIIKYDWNTSAYSNNVLVDCPKYTRKTFTSRTDDSYYTFYFYDEKTWNHFDYPFHKKYNLELDEDNYKQSFEGDYSSELSKYNWIGTCNYSDEDDSATTTLYFNREKMIIAENSSLIYKTYADFSLNELLAVYDEIGDCPVLHAKNTCYANIGNTFCYVNYSLDKSFGNSDVDKPGNDSEIDTENDPDASNNDINIEELDDCTSLLGDPTDPEKKEPAYYLVIIFNVLKYVAIILIIVLTVMDFIGAVASQDNDILKKATMKVIKRLILCAVIFVLPTLIKFALQLIYNREIGLCGIGE